MIFNARTTRAIETIISQFCIGILFFTVLPICHGACFLQAWNLFLTTSEKLVISFPIVAVLNLEFATLLSIQN